ncbi:Disco-interacting protein 2 [Toxocara canis]|uniref:Disco-interacting protein 2 n=1 Tax=Toxocara canis TaxID=6265 RepID=A0A0B2VCD1_TOXCA|nr:Disco-interacting protein 2 [Toxocara canis]
MPLFVLSPAVPLAYGMSVWGFTVELVQQTAPLKRHNYELKKGTCNASPSDRAVAAAAVADVEMLRLPSDVRERLAQLELELSEGDITQKGYDKKRQQLLAPFVNSQTNGGKATASPKTKAHRRHQRRLTRDESRFHSGDLSVLFLSLESNVSGGHLFLPALLPSVASSFVVIVPFNGDERAETFFYFLNLKPSNQKRPSIYRQRLPFSHLVSFQHQT